MIVWTTRTEASLGKSISASFDSLTHPPIIQRIVYGENVWGFRDRWFNLSPSFQFRIVVICSVQRGIWPSWHLLLGLSVCTPPFLISYLHDIFCSILVCFGSQYQRHRRKQSDKEGFLSCFFSGQFRSNIYPQKNCMNSRNGFPFVEFKGKGKKTASFHAWKSTSLRMTKRKNKLNYALPQNSLSLMKTSKLLTASILQRMWEMGS